MELPVRKVFEQVSQAYPSMFDGQRTTYHVGERAGEASDAECTFLA